MGNYYIDLLQVKGMKNFSENEKKVKKIQWLYL